MTVERDFLLYLMCEEWGSEYGWHSWIKECVNAVVLSILNNEALKGFSASSRGLRREICYLFYSLFWPKAKSGKRSKSDPGFIKCSTQGSEVICYG